MSAVLSPGEQLDFTALETVVREGLATFIEVGQALAEIRDRRLYRATHGTFEEYAHDRWLLSRTRAYQLIDAAAVTTALSTNGGHGDVCVDHDLPANERQARELVPLKDDEQAMVEVWRGLRERHGASLSAQLVKVEVEKRLGRPVKVECPGCPRHVLVERIDAPRVHRPGKCVRCGNKLPSEEPVKVKCPTCDSVVRTDRLHGGRRHEHDPAEITISSTYEIGDSERKRQLAGKALDRFWALVSARGRQSVLGDEPLHEVIHLDRALALLTDEEIAEAIASLEAGIAETEQIVGLLKARLKRGAS